jgi:hypothetical protein
MIVSLALIVLLYGLSYGQDNRTDFYDKIKNYDLSTILTADSILTEDREDSKDKIKRAEALGSIGDNFCRFHIHFISIIQKAKCLCQLEVMCIFKVPFLNFV